MSDICKFAEKCDERLSKRFGYQFTSISRDALMLLHGNSVEVGARRSCGKTDQTAHIYSEWMKLVSLMKKIGFKIKEERVKHKNSYATLGGGFWESTIFSVEADPPQACT